MATFCNHHISPAVDNFSYYDNQFTLYYQIPLAPVIWIDQNVSVFGYVHADYLIYSNYWFPLYHQPYVGASYNYTAESYDYQQQFIAPCDDSWIQNVREEDEIVLSEEELRNWDLLDQDLVVYDSTDDDDGLSEYIITKHLITRDHNHDYVGAEICVVCQDSLFQEDEKIATLDCGHEFHEGCIRQWLMLKNCCPLCKATGVRL